MKYLIIVVLFLTSCVTKDNYTKPETEALIDAKLKPQKENLEAIIKRIYGKELQKAVKDGCKTFDLNTGKCGEEKTNNPKK